MNQPTDLVLIGSTLLLALAAHAVGQRIHIPRVTLLLLLGALSGPELLDLLPDGADRQFEFVTQLTLAMVGFLLGERMLLKNLAEGREALIVSLVVTVVTALVVAGAVWLVTDSLAAALLLGSIATATAPAATLDVLREAGAKGPLTRLVYQVVAIDDAWGAILFSICLVSAELVMGNHATGPETLGMGIVEVGGALLLGLVLGVPMAWLTGRLRPGEPMLLEAAGFVFVAAGIAGVLGLSYLLTCMTLGVVVANRARHHIRPFRSIEGISDPFLAIFFFMAGYQLEWAMLPSLGVLGLVYIAARVVGRLAGGRFGGYLAGSTPHTQRRIGACLMPQAGLAMGLALLATGRLPELAYILPLIIGTTVIFELVGPPLTLLQLRHAGETGQIHPRETGADD
ncbi:MAG: cation:proton antiporter [Pseudomonadota bacterium]